MTTDETVMALRICNRKKGHRCSECPIFSRYDHGVCKRMVDLSAADLIESLQAKLAAERAKYAELQRYNVDCTKQFGMLQMDKVNLQTLLTEAQRQLRKAVELSGELIALCDMPKEWRDKLLRRHINRPGDYMGCGYDFLDAYYRIFDEFSETADDEIYKAIRISAEQKIEKWRGPQEAGKGEAE